jgi:hypothetical protein
MSTMTPFRDDSASAAIGGLTVENGTDAIAVYGRTDITRDQAGLSEARALADFLHGVVAALEAVPDLPARIPSVKPTGTIQNPF